MAQDPTVVAVNAGTPMILLPLNNEKSPAVNLLTSGSQRNMLQTMTAGLAKNGAKPVLGSFSTLCNEVLTKISHDLSF